MIRGIIFDCYGVLCEAGGVRKEPSLEFAKRLHATYKVALLSNIGRASIATMFTPDELAARFDAVVLSGEVGMVKPDPAIYALTAQRLGLPPEECIMIDDSQTNVHGATMAGMHGVLYITAAQCEADVMRLLDKEANA